MLGPTPPLDLFGWNTDHDTLVYGKRGKDAPLNLTPRNRLDRSLAIALVRRDVVEGEMRLTIDERARHFLKRARKRTLARVA